MRIIKPLIIIAIIAGLFLAYQRAVNDLTPHPQFALAFRGTETIVQYPKYGAFENPGTNDYKYVVADRNALANAVGEGVYPNTQVFKDPVYKSLKGEGKLDGDKWLFVGTDDARLGFYKWATTNEETPGVRQFYTTLGLENGQLMRQAIKGFFATIVHFPKAVSYTYWNSPWYPAKAAIANIKYLTRRYPLLKMKLAGSEISIKNGYDLDPTNDIYSITPGKIVRCKAIDLVETKDTLRLSKVRKNVGNGKVRLAQYVGGDWQLLVDNRPYMIKAVAYGPTKLGESPDEGTLKDWTWADYNKNGIPDGPYEAWVDANRNNRRDWWERLSGDFELLKKMGANTIRIYDHEGNTNKKVLRDLYKRYGIRAIMGDLLGTYAVGSGVSWYRGTNYADPVQCERLKARVRRMVLAHKDEPYVLLWMLGNETNYGVANSAKRFPKAFYSFVNEVAKMIKEIDPDHPVAVCNGDMLYLDIFAKCCPDVDIIGTNSYRGWHGFGFWNDVRAVANKPVLVTEYGAPAYWDGKSDTEAEEAQAEYHRGAWDDIFYNSAGYGCGNALGGVVFEWVDEWWKAYEPSLHDTHKQWPGPVKGGWFYEEWLGLTSQGNGSDSPFMRQLRRSYYAYKSMWNPSLGDKLRNIWYTIVIYLAF